MNEPVAQKSAYLEHIIGAGVVILRRNAGETEVLLIRRGKAPRLGEWSIPGGRQESGETVRETALREIREETGLALERLRLVDVIDHISGARHWTLIDFCALWEGGEAKAGSDAAEVRWVAINALDDYGLWEETKRVILDAAALSCPADGT